MSNKEQTKDHAQKDTGDRTPQVGALLRASRLRVGEDLRDVADILCIRYLYLEAIEECRYGDLPGNTYAVGFIRSYAEHLGLDGDEVVRRYRLEQTGQKSATDLAFPTPVPDSGVPKGAIVFVGVLIALLVYGGWYVTTTDESILSDLISPVPDHLKHLVTGDDAPADAKTDNAAGAAVTDPSASGVEQMVRETSEAAEQMASAAGEAAQRTAEAAAEAAATASEAVTEKAEKVVDSAAETAESAAASATETLQGTTAAPMAETPAMPAAETPAPATAGSGGADAPTPAESAAVPPSAPVETSAPVAPESTESAPAPRVTESTPATSPESATAQTQTAPSEAPAPEARTAPSEAPATDAPAAQTQTAPQSEAPAPDAAPTTEREVTAEDLNTLVLRQATSGAGTASDAPPPPARAPLNSGNATNTSGIVIRATSSSWVEIRDPATSTIVFTGLMSAGNTFNVPDKDGLILDTGNAGALDITVDGASVPKIGGVGAVRKNVPLDTERLKAGTAASR